MTNNQKLKEIMSNYGLSQPEVADRLHVNINTVKKWCSSPESKSYSPMPLNLLELLQLKTSGQ